MAPHFEGCTRGGQPAYEVHPGPDGTFSFNDHGREVAERPVMSPEGQAQSQMIEETFRCLIGREPTTTQQ